MSDTVSWILTLAVKDGQMDAFNSLMDEMVEHTRGEPGALMYEWFVADDGGTVHIYERYADSEATLAHLAGFGEHFAERFMAAADLTGFYVYGEPSDAIRAGVSPLGAQILGPLGGFTR